MDVGTLLPLAILLLLVSTWFVLYYAKRKTPIFIILLSIISFGLGSAAVALLPIDLSYAASLSNAAAADDNGGENDNNDAQQNNQDGHDQNNNNNNLDNNPTYIPWKITYWTTFLLAWLILPITRETLLSGHFTLLQRIRNGFTKSIKAILLMSVCGFIAVIAMAIHLKSVHLVTIVLPVLMALGNTYGLVLVSLLLGNGLVNVPKRFWREACPANELRRIRMIACGVEEELFDSIMALEDVEDKIEEVCATAVNLRESGDENVTMMENEEGGVSLGTTTSRRRRGCWSLCWKADQVTQFHECLEELVRRKNEGRELCSERRTRRGGNSGTSPRNRRRASSDDGNDDAAETINTMDVKYLVTLNTQLKKAQERVISAELRWNELVDHNRIVSALMNDDDTGSVASGQDGNDGAYNSNLLSSSSSSSSGCHRVKYILQRFWMRHLRYHTYRFIALTTAVLSVFVLLSEVTLASSLNLSPFSWTLAALDQWGGSSSQILFQLAALIPLLYMSICVYTCLFQMSLLGPYCLRGNRQSNGVALVRNAQYLVRLQFPLGYNYLLMLKYDMSNCAFSDIMSDMATIPFFGTSFSVYAPLLILLVCALSLFDCYPKMLHWLGIEHEDALLLGDQEDLECKVNEGIQLMTRDAERRGISGGQSATEKLSLKQSSNLIV